MPFSSGLQSYSTCEVTTKIAVCLLLGLVLAVGGKSPFLFRKALITYCCEFKLMLNMFSFVLGVEILVRFGTPTPSVLLCKQSLFSSVWNKRRNNFLSRQFFYYCLKVNDNLFCFHLLRRKMVENLLYCVCALRVTHEVGKSGRDHQRSVEK